MFVSTDPFNVENLPIEVAEVIISLLSLQDRLNACVVSKHWNAAIGNSSIFKKKTKFSIKQNETTKKLREFYDIMYMSKRSYNTIEISNKKLNVWFYLALGQMNSKSVFETVTIDKLVGKTDLMEALKTFNLAKSVKLMNIKSEFQIHNDDGAAKIKERINFNLENLEFLDISGMDAECFDVINRQYSKLKSLSVKHLDSETKSPQTIGILEFISMNQSTLKHFKIDWMVAGQMFKNNIDNMLPFLKLRTISIELCPPQENGNMVRHTVRVVRVDMERFVDNVIHAPDSPHRHLRNPAQNENVNRNLESFLKTQSHCLESFKMICKHPELQQDENDFYQGYLRDDDDIAVDLKDLDMLFNLWSSFTSLKKLDIQILKKHREEDLPRVITSLKRLKNNFVIECLSIKYKNLNAMSFRSFQEIIIEFLCKCPNLKNLYVTNLSKKTTNFCVMHLKSLRSIKCAEMDRDVLQWYELLKETAININVNIRIQDCHC